MKPVWLLGLCLLLHLPGLWYPPGPGGEVHAQETTSSTFGGWNRTDAADPALDAIRRRIERTIFYPNEARRRGIEGTVELLFTLSADGHVQGVWVLRSSGSPILDEAAIQVVKQAAPYPIVADWPAVLQFQLPITYRLK